MILSSGLLTSSPERLYSLIAELRMAEPSVHSTSLVLITAFALEIVCTSDLGPLTVTTVGSTTGVDMYQLSGISPSTLTETGIRCRTI